MENCILPNWLNSRGVPYGCTGTLEYLDFIMILSMRTQWGFIHLYVVISLYVDIKHVIRIDDRLLESN